VRRWKATFPLIGTKRQYPTTSAARDAAETIRTTPEPIKTEAPMVKALIEQYRAEKMPTRYSTRRSYEVWLGKITAQWGERRITELQARPVELWLQSLPLAPKSRAHMRGLIATLWDFCMWRADIPTQRNPIELVTIRDASKRQRQPRSLTVEEFQNFAQHLADPFHTVALLCVCLGLRISECLALKRADVNWLESKLTVERGIVRQRVADTKTQNSRKAVYVSADLLEVLKNWKQQSQFRARTIGRSPVPRDMAVNLGAMTKCWRRFAKAGTEAGIGRVLTHSMRHTYRLWLDTVGTPIAVQ
jgi:integrase